MRLVFEQTASYESQWGAITAIASKLGRVPQAKRRNSENGIAAVAANGFIYYGHKHGLIRYQAVGLDAGRTFDVSFGYVGVTPMFEKAGFRRVMPTDAHSDHRTRWLVRLDFAYIEAWSIWLDISIIARTIPAVLSGRGAY